VSIGGISFAQNDEPEATLAYNRGLAYNKQGEYDRAIAELNRAIALKPNYAEAYCERGIAYSEKGDYGQAMLDYDRSIELNPDSAITYYDRGIVHAHLGKDDMAISDYTRAIELRPNSDTYLERGDVFSKKCDYDQAIADYSMAIKLNPKAGIAYSNRGRSLFSKGNYDESWINIHKAQELGYKVPEWFLEKLKKASGREK
jgi:tetratricopeptide (TPR) repeat protein